jgi:hypothetical protein
MALKEADRPPVDLPYGWPDGIRANLRKIVPRVFPGDALDGQTGAAVRLGHSNGLLEGH